MFKLFLKSIFNPLQIMWIDGEGEGGDTGVATIPTEGNQGEPPIPAEPQKYKIDDGEHTIDEIKQWRDDSVNKSKWQKEYTQKSQSLMQARDIYDFLASDTPVEEKWKWFEDNFPKQAAKIEALGGTPDDYVKKLEGRIQSMEKRYDQDRQLSQTRDLQGQLASCKDTYKDKWNEDVEDIVMSLWIAKPNLYKNVSEAAKAYFEKHEKLFSSQQKNWIDGKNKDIKNPANMPKGGGAPAVRTTPLNEKEKLKQLGDDIFKGD